MAKILVKKSKALNGEVNISGSKNAALPIMAVTMLAEGECVIEGAPLLTDIYNMKNLMQHLGSSIEILDEGTLKIQQNSFTSHESPYELASKLRASFLVAGPLLARTGYAKIALPGGCQIGSRPVDLHIKGLGALGAKITQGHGYIELSCKKLKGANIYLDFPSVGATENILMAASLAQGQTTIENAAVEPEIVDLANFINLMGGDIKGAGTDTIRINGVKKLNGAKYLVIPDRIEAGTFMVAAAITKGNVKIKNVLPNHLKPISAKLREIGVNIQEGEDHIIVQGCDKVKPTDIKTLPFPGFPTDMQAQFTSLLSTIEGTSLIIETIFENRFQHAAELKRMGANIKIEGNFEIIEGTKQLSGAPVKATDLRAGAALVIAGLVAEGETEVSEAHHIDRGYYKFCEKLKSLGADLTRIDD